MGLFGYPVLMAADILLYDANIIPVGKDQVQHVEISRDIAQHFNHTFGETLVLPNVRIQDDAAAIPGLDGRKMSKGPSMNKSIEAGGRNLHLGIDLIARL
jgi:tryptophanyl-tRNA synthetase